jgi:hypothetical protein
MRQSDKTNTVKVTTPTTKLPITEIKQLTEDASAWPSKDGVKQKNGLAYCDGSTLTNTSGDYDDFNTANGSLVVPQGPFRTVEHDLTFSNTPAGWSLSNAKGVAYTDSEGNWRLVFNINASMSSATSGTVDIDGVVFGFTQPISVLDNTSAVASRAWVSGSGDTVNVSFASSNTSFSVSGDVSLSSQPTWAAANLESYPVVALFDNAGANVLGIPEADATTTGTVNTGAQTFAGSKEFQSDTTFNGAVATTNVNIKSDSNVTTDYSLRLDNAADTARTSFGAYGAESSHGFEWDLGATKDFTMYENGSIGLHIDVDAQHQIRTTNTSLTVPVTSITKGGNGQETAGNYFLTFQAGGSNCGGIQSNGTNTAAFFTLSDERLKKDISPLSGSLDKLMALEPSKYTFKGRTESQVGFIAQNMQESFPESVSSTTLESGDAGQPEEGIEYLSIAGWDATAAHIVAAMKEQQAMIEELKAEIALLKQ